MGKVAQNCDKKTKNRIFRTYLQKGAWDWMQILSPDGMSSNSIIEA